MKQLGMPIATGAAADVFAWGDGHVVKLYRPDYPEAMVEAEIARAQAAGKAGIPTPAIIDSVPVCGRRGVVFQRVFGPTMLESLIVRPEDCQSLASQFARLHADIHSHTAHDFPKVRDWIERILLQQANSSPARLAECLFTLDTMPEGDALCHGDFQPTNIIMAESGPTIVDWSHASRGNAMADVANSLLILRCMPISTPQPSHVMARITQVREEFCRSYLDEYCRIRALTPEQLMVWVKCLAVALQIDSDGLDSIIEWDSYTPSTTTRDCNVS